jgi:hypothetical protein
MSGEAIWPHRLLPDDPKVAGLFARYVLEQRIECQTPR